MGMGRCEGSSHWVDAPSDYVASRRIRQIKRLHCHAAGALEIPCYTVGDEQIHQRREAACIGEIGGAEWLQVVNGLLVGPQVEPAGTAVRLQGVVAPLPEVAIVHPASTRIAFCGAEVAHCLAPQPEPRGSFGALRGNPCHEEAVST